MIFPTLIGKKRTISYGVVTVVLLISTAYLLFPPQLKLFYVIDDAYLSEVEPQGTWSNMTCPQCGSQLERIVIDPDEPQMIDDAWRYAAYCRQEDIFWVADMPGFYFAGWYGPFNAYWKLTNTVAISIVIISGVALVLLAIKDKGLMRKKNQVERRTISLNTNIKHDEVNTKTSNSSFHYAGLLNEKVAVC